MMKATKLRPYEQAWPQEVVIAHRLKERAEKEGSRHGIAQGLAGEVMKELEALETYCVDRMFFWEVDGNHLLLTDVVRRLRALQEVRRLPKVRP